MTTLPTTAEGWRAVAEELDYFQLPQKPTPALDAAIYLVEREAERCEREHPCDACQTTHVPSDVCPCVQVAREEAPAAPPDANEPRRKLERLLSSIRKEYEASQVAAAAIEEGPRDKAYYAGLPAEHCIQEAQVTKLPTPEEAARAAETLCWLTHAYDGCDRPDVTHAVALLRAYAAGRLIDVSSLGPGGNCWFADMSEIETALRAALEKIRRKL